MSESLLFSELLDHVRSMIDEALKRYRADLARSTGTVPPNQLPGDGNTGDGYSPAAHASTHAEGGSDPVSPASIGACADDDSRLSDSRTPTGSAGGDLSGTYPNPTVAKLHGRTVASTAPTDGQVLVYNNSSSQWEPGSASGGAPAAHAASHQHGGSDEIATATPGANAIPKAGSGGTLADGWLSSAISRITSIGLSLPSIFSVSGSPLTANGTISATLANQSANLVFAGPSSGGAAAPTFRALVADDIPSLDSAKITTGEIPRSPLTTRGDLLTRDASTHTRLAIGAAGRYLRSDGTDPSWSQLLASDLVFSGLTTGQVLRATSASAAAFGALDLANTNAVTGILSPANGGTGVNNGSFALTIPATGTATLRASSATAGRVAFWSDANSVSHDSALVWDNTNKRLGINATPSVAFHIVGIARVETTSNAVNGVLEFKDGSPGQTRVLAFNFTNGSDLTVGQVAFFNDSTATNQYLRFLTGNGKFISMRQGYFEMDEVTAPSAPAGDQCRLFVRDNGSGKTQLCAIFSSGAIQVIATQP